MSEPAKSLRLLTGKVISDKANKTRIVQVVWSRQHPRFKKVVKRNTKYHIHDENNESSLGDVVSFKETRPFSKTKSWELVGVVEKA